MIVKDIKSIYLKLLKWLGLNESFLGYIAGPDKLPAPLSVEDEYKLLVRLMNKDKEAKNILVEKNLRLVVYIAKKFESSGVNIEDLVSIGTIGLMKAVNSYNLDKNIKLATYASRCIENEILMYLRKNNKIKTEISIDEPINVDSEGNDLSLADILGTDSDSIFRYVEDEESKKMLSVAIQKLNKREKTIMKLRYGFDGKDELTQKEVADKLGISQSYISRLEKKVINNLRNEFII